MSILVDQGERQLLFVSNRDSQSNSAHEMNGKKEGRPGVTLIQWTITTNYSNWSDEASTLLPYSSRHSLND